MLMFLYWLAGILFLIACYLAFLWWHPRRRSRFQVRLTALFLLFAIVPSVPLIFLVSTMATNTADLLLVPRVEGAMLDAIESIKKQFEDTAGRFVQAVRGKRVTSDLLKRWQMDYYLVWRRDGDGVRLIEATGKEDPSKQRGLRFGPDRVREVWGQVGSQLEPLPVEQTNETSNPPGRCRVWLPRGPEEMIVLGFPVATEIAATKQELIQTLRVYNSLSLIKERALQDQIIWAIAAAAIFVLGVLSVLVARTLSRKISEPIEELTAVTARVAAGDLQAQARLTAKDEIGQLMAAFNQMIRDLRASRDRLIVTERLAAWREVARQVSHEIKNPLTPIQLAIYRIRQRLDPSVVSQNAIRESFQSIEKELSSLKHLADEFSDFARLPSANRKPENINDIIKLTARLFEDVRLRLDLAAEVPERPLDHEQITRVLINLIKNAVEATPERACEVTITTRKESNRARITIADNGPGLPAEVQARLFEPDFTTKPGGSGLGLVVVKRIIDQHDGSIEVDSAPGKGTVFSILI